MNHILRYGIDSSIHLESSDNSVWVANETPENVIEAPFKATVGSLGSPLDYPALDRCVVPGDRVVLALGVAVPGVDQIVAATIDQLLRAEVDPEDITVLKPFDDGVDCSQLVPDDVRSKISQEVHDAKDPDRLAHLAITESGEPVLLNRLIADADFVLPIGCCRDADDAGYFGAGDTIFPTFADKKTIRQFRAPGLLDQGGKVKKRLIRQVGQVGWLLGAAFAIRVVPGPAGKILAVLAGETNSVEKQARKLYDSAWQVLPDGESKMVVALIEGSAEEQTWHNIARAVEVASRFTENDGAIVICSELAAEPGPALALLQWAGVDARDSVLKQISKDRHYDVLTTTRLLRVLKKHRVFLLSQLDQAYVETLDFVHVESEDEIARLVQQYGNCVVLRDAAHIAVKT